MATITEMTDTVQEQVTTGIKQAQEINLAALEVARDFAALFAPARRNHEVTKEMPDPTRLIDQWYGFAGQLLELQHDYAVRVVETLRPAVQERKYTAAERRAEERKATEDRKGTADKS